jgi:hypothetical protein
MVREEVPGLIHEPFQPSAMERGPKGSPRGLGSRLIAGVDFFACHRVMITR